jgi:serine/threonine-protein kinase
VRATGEVTTLRAGDNLDRYELLCPLAYGGMAAVWLARFAGKLGFEKLVVIKTILPHYATDAQFQQMFVDETRIASRIEHTNVARILDVGEQGEILYLVMEWVDGDSLSKLEQAVEKNQARFPLGVSLRIVADAAAGLHAAHQLRDRDGHLLGVVHRDVSPQNLLVSTQGVTKVIDFGVAKARDRMAEHTQRGHLKGKVKYMAPEHALARPSDHRSDVWSLGAVLYEMLGGKAPYDQPNEVATLQLLTNGAPPPPLPPDIPAPVVAIVERALAFHPEQRYSTAEEMQLAIEAVTSDLRVGATASAVTAFVGQHVGDRAASRKRAVDEAIEAANRRSARPPDSGSGSGVKILRAAPVAMNTPMQNAPPLPGHAPPPDLPSMPSMPSMPSARTADFAPTTGWGSAWLALDHERQKTLIAVAIGIGGACAIVVVVAVAHRIFSGGSHPLAPASAIAAPPPPPASATAYAAEESLPEPVPPDTASAASSNSSSTSATTGGTVPPAGATHRRPSPPMLAPTKTHAPSPPKRPDLGF